LSYISVAESIGVASTTVKVLTCFLVNNDIRQRYGMRQVVVAYLTALHRQLLYCCCETRISMLRQSDGESASERINSTHKMHIVALVFLPMSVLAASDCPQGKFIAAWYI